MANKKKIKEIKEELVVEKKPTKVAIDISDLEGFKKELADLKKQNEMLLEVADKRALDNYLSKNKEDKKPGVRVRKIDGKIVVGWDDMPNNDVGKSMKTLAYEENQIVRILFEDGTKQDYSLLDFNRRFEYIYCVVVGKLKDDVSGTITYKLVNKADGKELTIDSKFVN